MLQNNNIYEKLNEGMGGAYERIAYTNIIKRIAQKYNCKNILELNATYIAGIPGFNSCLLAQSGYNVTVAVTERDYKDTKEVWRLTGLKANIVKIKSDNILISLVIALTLYITFSFLLYKDPYL